MGCGVSRHETVKPEQVKVVSCKRSKGQGKDAVPYSGRSVAMRVDTEVSRGRSSRWSSDHPGREVKAIYRAKGRTERELSGKGQGDVSNRHLRGRLAVTGRLRAER